MFFLRRLLVLMQIFREHGTKKYDKMVLSIHRSKCARGGQQKIHMVLPYLIPTPIHS